MPRGETCITLGLCLFIAAFASFHLASDAGWLRPSDRTKRAVTAFGWAVLIVLAVLALMALPS